MLKILNTSLKQTIILCLMTSCNNKYEVTDDDISKKNFVEINNAIKNKFVENVMIPSSQKSVRVFNLDSSSYSLGFESGIKNNDAYVQQSLNQYFIFKIGNKTIKTPLLNDPIIIKDSAIYSPQEFCYDTLTIMKTPIIIINLRNILKS